MNGIVQKFGELKSSGINLDPDNILCGYYFDYRYGKDICSGSALLPKCYAICFLISNVNQNLGYCINTYEITQYTSYTLLDSKSRKGTWTYSFAHESATDIQAYADTNKTNWYTIWLKEV